MDQTGNGEACKVFGINVKGFEHDIFDMIMRMEQSRQQQLVINKARGGGKKTKKMKGETEVKRLICMVNYDGGEKKNRGRKSNPFLDES